jgi:exopolysaccharide biosynthesis protein
MAKEKDGCAIFLRRTFLFFVGLAIAKLLHEYFSLAQNRVGFWQQLQSLKQTLEQKYLSWRTGEPQVANTFPVETSSQVQVVESIETSPTIATKGKPVKFEQKTLFGVSFHQTTLDLNDPETFITIGLANNAPQANTNGASSGDESFEAMVKRAQAAVVVNGTFFSIDQEKRVMGNMVAGGKFLKYSQWENYGTTFGIKAGNELEMVTARDVGQPDWSKHWFSLTCGPRLLKDGQVWL